MPKFQVELVYAVCDVFTREVEADDEEKALNEVTDQLNNLVSFDEIVDKSAIEIEL